MNISEWLQESTSSLRGAGIEPARLDCLLLLEDTLQVSKEWLLAHSDHDIEQLDLLTLNNKIVQRAERTPLAYIRNRQEFYGRSFYVDENVLIPRPESEAIIDLLLSISNQAPTTILDIGTGTGCLAITAKLELPNAQVIATDISNSALDVAIKNARAMGAKIGFTQVDLMPDTNYEPPIAFLANLPYVPDNLMTSKEIEKEPHLALFSGTDGMYLYSRFWSDLKHLNNTPAYIITESLESQHQQMEKLATKSGFKKIKTNVLAQLFVPA